MQLFVRDITGCTHAVAADVETNVAELKDRLRVGSSWRLRATSLPTRLGFTSGNKKCSKESHFLSHVAALNCGGFHNTLNVNHD